jgi:hypothetical protein
MATQNRAPEATTAQYSLAISLISLLAALLVAACGAKEAPGWLS